MGAIGRVGLNTDTVGAPELVEVIDIERTQIDLHGLEDITDADTQLASSRAVNIGIELRHIDLVSGEDTCEFLSLGRFGDKGLGGFVHLHVS